ncbi:MAG TPA: LptF/LptG family permease [Chthonomonadales bacterium]|nr:LptF/LptG family permease [Chthonomonadales bacterium]
MKKLDRYLAGEMVVPFLIGQCAVVLMLTGTVLYNNAETFLNFGIPAAGVARIAVFFMPYLVSLTMPVAMAIAASLAVSRLARDSEITVARAAGISLHRIFLPVTIAGLMASLAGFYFGERVVPWANQQYERTMRELTEDVGFLSPRQGQVVQSPDRRYTASIGRIDLREGKARLSDVMLIVREPAGGPVTIIYAGNADYDDGLWTLYDARTFIHEARGVRHRVARSERVEINFRIAERVFDAIALQLPLYTPSSAASVADLVARIAAGRQQGWVNHQDVLDLHFRLSVPFSCLVFAIACPPLALRFARGGGFMGVLMSIVLVFLYWNTLLAARILGARYPEVLPPVVAGWGQNVVLAALGLLVLRRSE